MASALLTTTDVAELLGIRVRTVQRLAQDGELPHAQKLPGVRGGYLFDRGTVELFKRQRAARKASAA